MDYKVSLVCFLGRNRTDVDAECRHFCEVLHLSWKHDPPPPRGKVTRVLQTTVQGCVLNQSQSRKVSQ